MPIYFAAVLSFFARTYRWESAYQATATTAPTVPGSAHKISTDIRPMLPPFLQGSKMSQILAQISTPVVFGPPYFWTGALYWKTKTNLSRTGDRPTSIPNLVWVGPSQLPEQLAQWVPERVKVENFLYILHSSDPRRVQCHQCYTTYWGRSCCKKSTVPYLPIRPLHFTEGQKSAAHTRVNLGPRHISKTITGRKLKFYVRIDRAKYSFKAWKNFPLGACGGAAPPSVNLGPPHISKTVRARRLKFYTHLHRTKCSVSAWQFSARGGGGRRQTGRPQVAMPRNCHVF